MRTAYAGKSFKAAPRGVWGTLMRLVVLVSAAAALLAVLLVGFIIVLPLALAGGIALHLYLRRRMRQAQRRASDGVIDAEYTVIKHH